MNVVYIVLAHDYPDQLIRLVKKLQAPNGTILIHQDKNMDSAGAAKIKNAFKELADVRFLPRFSVRWGGFSLSRATNAAISQIIDQKVACDYAILLSEQDYPIKSNSSFLQFLENNRGKSYMEVHALPYENWTFGGLHRIEQWHFGMSWIGSHFLRARVKYYLELFCDHVLPARRFPQGFQPYGGSTWWVLSRDCLEYVHAFNRTHAEFIRFFNYVANASELYYQTILKNSPLSSSIENNKLTYTDLSLGGVHPKTLQDEDFEQSVKTHEFFARKFDMQKDIQILDMLDVQSQEAFISE
ncbi:MAG: beta-1,6-N-acetylglucosaminyltransferase [Anaerolineaceae bacterium]|nr:beta-1,6-N-acetylglucosaminyltransferase [Anaerolineaceae bacterium]